MPTVLLHGLAEKKEKEIIIRTNVTNGRWDWDRLANNDWDVSDLDDWGVDTSFLGIGDDTDIDDLFEEAKNQKEKEQVTKITVSVPESLTEQLGEIMEAVKESVAAYEGVEVK